MEQSLKLVFFTLTIITYIRGEPPVGDGVTIVSDADANPSSSYGTPSTYSPYQPTGPQANSYTTAITSARTGYQSSRPTYGTAYLPVIPVSASLYSFSSAPTTPEYGTYGAKTTAVYGTSQPWASSSQPWATGSSNPWATLSTSSGPWVSSSQPWAGTTSPWATASQPWYGAAQPWTSGAQPWASTTQPWASSSGPWASSSGPWAGSSQPWSGVSSFSSAISVNNFGNQDIIGIKPPPAK